MNIRHAATEIENRTQAVIDGLREVEGPLLPVLHALQKEFGYIPRESLPVIALALNLSRAEVHGVVSFYHDFRNQPQGRHVIKICRAEACQSLGGEELAARLSRLLGLGFHETAKDGAVTLEPVYCLGLCACAPSAMVDGQLIGRLDRDKIDEIAAAVRI